MSWRDRPYAGEPGPPELRLRLPKPTTAVTWLIVINVVTYFLDAMSQNWSLHGAHRLFGLSLAGVQSYHVWQIFSYMFMHGDLFHLLFNMLGLYVFGCEFERSFGRHRFLQLYATCGLVGGVAYLVLTVVEWRVLGEPWYVQVPLVGASGAVYGLLIAAIIFFPHIQVVLVIFPVPIRVFGLILAAIVVLQLISPGEMSNRGGQVCHLAGAATGLAILRAWGILPRIRLGSGRIVPAITIGGQRGDRHRGAWARRQKKIAEEQAEVDRILAKVHEQGLRSLTRREKKILARATQREQQRDREMARADRL